MHGAIVFAATEHIFSCIFPFSPINRNLRFTPTFPMMEKKQIFHHFLVHFEFRFKILHFG